jgi:ribosomal protein L37AE/L43A
VRRCTHGVYWPKGDDKAYGCQACNPLPTEKGRQPILPKYSNDPLNATKTEELEKCKCGNIRTFSSTTCRVCGEPFEGDATERQQGAANSKTPGTCPDCGSTVHYVGPGKKEWTCADCGAVFPAPKIR